MISLDQVLLLEEKVESAVEKIKQLEAENDALRNKCSELTNALSAKTEQLASFENEQKTIESGIIKAIDRLNSIENSVLKAAGPAATQPAQPEPVAVEEEIAEEPSPITEMSFDQMMPVEDEPPFEEVPVDEAIEEPIDEGIDESDQDSETKDQLGFDIF